MAKRNSTKTATKEALQASEPKLQVFNKWQGVSILGRPADWVPTDLDGAQETDLAFSFNHIQNNLLSTGPNGTMETRPQTREIALVPAGLEFTGVVCVWGSRIYAAMTGGNEHYLKYHDLAWPAEQWSDVQMIDPDDPSGVNHNPITEVGWFSTKLVVLTQDSSGKGEIFVGEREDDKVSSALHIPEPTQEANLSVQAQLAEGTVTRIQVQYVYTNQFGSTLPSPISVINVDRSPVEFSSIAYLKIDGTCPMNYGITGVDIYCTLDENVDAIFIGHVNITNNQTSWVYNWLGALADTTVWTSVSLQVPTENNTKGVDARYFNHHDGRLFFWGGSEPYRLWIGGNPGNELSVARGIGGAFVDIEPGTGQWVSGTEKFKTYNGATIITVMCGHTNTSMVTRYNLLENNITVTNELQAKGYLYEKVNNVIGCNSRWGFGVFEDGLYSIGRYGLALTTQAMESSNQLRIQYVSEQIEGVFQDRIGNILDDARLVYIDGVCYMVFSNPDTLAPYLDNVVLCYDIALKAWYTITYPTDAHILHVFNIDSHDYEEGLGIITPSTIFRMQTTTPPDTEKPNFDVFIQSGEIGVRQPLQETCYLCQVELYFDYFIGDLDVYIRGTDYYGRDITVHKIISWDTMQRDHREWIRVNMLMENYNIQVKGPARFRLTHFISKVYTQSKKIALPYGWDSHSYYTDRRGDVDDHHYLRDYNNLRNAIVT